MKESVSIGIIGLGKVGSCFIDKLSEYGECGINILGVAEVNLEAPGIKIATSKGIKVYKNEEEILELQDELDVIFDLTGDKSVERKLRLAMAKTGINTVIVSRPVALIIWKLITEERLPLHSIIK